MALQPLGIDRKQDWREIAHRIVEQLREPRDVDRAGVDAAQHQGVAVGRRLRDQLGGDVAAAAGVVLHHHGLAPGLCPARADQARIDFGDAAYREGDDDAVRF